MKRAIFLTSLFALALPSLQADPVYNITLSNSETYSNCTVSENGAAKVRFRGTNSKGKTVNKTVRTADITSMKEVSFRMGAGAKDAAKDEKAAEGEEAEDAKDAKDTNPAAQPQEKDAEQTEGGKGNASEVCRRLRQRMDEVEQEFGKISKPSRSLASRVNSTKRDVTSRLKRLEETATEAAALQATLKHNAVKEYQFTIVTAGQRDKYLQDATAAYKAMLTDVKEKPSARKVAGLDKFEVLRERYQGIPEYKDADAWYEKTLKDLDKTWSKWQTTEEKKRERLQSAKRQKMEEDDEKDYKKLEKQLKAEGDDIAKVWYKPNQRNLRMINNCLNKVHDAQRRREASKDRQSDSIGCVPDLLTKFWAKMDNARKALVAGNLESANDILEDDDVFNRIIRLPRNVMPDEYKEPLREQRQDILREIKNRSRDNERSARDLERKLSTLERDSSNIESRIESLMEDIEREQANDVGESTVNVKEQSGTTAADGEEGDDTEAPKKDAKKGQGKDAKPEQSKKDKGKGKDKGGKKAK